MQVLIDTDVFCKLAIADLLADSLRLLAARIAECGRLPALPHMLRRGRLPAQYGEDACARLLPLAQEMPTAPAAGSSWLDRLVGAPEIDPGEAQLFAAAAERGMMLMTGDNRAIKALKSIDGFPEALSGRIVTHVAILQALCDDLGSATVRGRVGSLMSLDKTIRVCFSGGSPNPRGALESYARNFEAEALPLTLWQAPRRGGP
jgi:hypothetical protein